MLSSKFYKSYLKLPVLLIPVKTKWGKAFESIKFEYLLIKLIVFAPFE